MAYSFVMISPNLHAIWVFLFLNLSQDLKLVLLIYFGTLGDGYSLKGSNKKPSRHNYVVPLKEIEGWPGSPGPRVPTPSPTPPGRRR
jgi:hypothetical protein